MWLCRWRNALGRSAAISIVAVWHDTHAWVADHARVAVVPVVQAAHVGLHHADAVLGSRRALHEAAAWGGAAQVLQATAATWLCNDNPLSGLTHW